MNDFNYRATAIGGLTCVTVSFAVYVTWIFLAPVTLAVTFFMEGFGYLLFGEDYSNNFSIGVYSLTLQMLLLIIACFWYYKILLKAKQENKPFNKRWLLSFYAILQFIIHPIGCYIWLFISGDLYDHRSPIQTAAYQISLTVPFSSVFFVILGLAIDLIWNRKQK